MRVPVWVDGAKVGETPFQAEIPLCAKIEVGEGALRNTVDVELKMNANVEVVHQLHRVERSPEEIEKQLDDERKADSVATAGKKQDQANEAAKDAAPQESKMKVSTPISIAMMVLGAAGLGIGIYENSVLAKERENYDNAVFVGPDDADAQWDKVKSAETSRNVLYGVGAGLLLGGVVVFFVF